MKKPLVSISCITYNHEPFIRQCIDGFLMQKCDFDFEILIHDDASTDGTQDIIREYHEKHPEIIKPILQVENQLSKGVNGINRTYNFPRVKGKYIALCDGDDYWIDPLKLQKQVEFLEGNESYILTHSGVQILYDKAGIIRETNDHVINYEDKSKHMSFQELLLSSSYIIRTSTVLFRTDSFKLAQERDPWLFSGKFLMGDTPLWYSLSFFGKFHFNSEVQAIYRRHHSSATQGFGSLFKKLRFVLSKFELRYYLINKDRYFSDSFRKEIINSYNKSLYQYKLFDEKYEPMFIVENKKPHVCNYMAKTIIVIKYKLRKAYRALRKTNR